MRIVECEQRSEEWDKLRARPTASNFAEFCTPAKGEYAKGATDYACKVIERRLGLHTEAPPNHWMEWGVEQEPRAREAYTAKTGREVEEVGFILPDRTDAYGGSPDGLVGDDGLIEIKCPKPSTLIRYHADKKLPNIYKPQIQGLLLISGRAWCDFWAWHPGLNPFLLRVEADPAYQTKIAENLLRLLEEIERIELSMSL